MVNRKKQTLLVIAGILVLAIALGVSAVFAQSGNQNGAQSGNQNGAQSGSQPAGQVAALSAAQPVFQGDDDDQDEPEAGEVEDEAETPPGSPFGEYGDFGRRGGHHGHGFGGPLEGLTPMDEVVAESLGVTVEQLQKAHAQVFATLIEENGGGFRGQHGFAGSDELNTLLAQALSDISGREITVEALEAAHQAAREAMLAQLPEELRPSEEQLALMEAQQALKGAIDREAVLLEAAEGLGLDPVAVQDALKNPQSLFTLLEEAGVTVENFMAAHQEAQANAVQNAVPEFITQEQADLILNSNLVGLHSFGSAHGFGNMHGFGGEHGGMGGGFHGQGGFGGRGWCPGGISPDGGNAPATGTSL